MNPTAIALVLAAAIAHASWNLFGKQAAATGAAFFIWLLAVCVTIGYLPVVAITVITTHPHLAGLNWLFLAGTGLLHAGYFLFLQLGYRLGDLSVAYPMGRGTGALLAAVTGIVLLGERPGPVTVAGILAIVTGVVVIGWPARQPAEAATAAAAPRGTQPAMPLPGTARPGTASPGTASPGTASPSTARPGTARPGTARPGTALPGTVLPAGALPGPGLPAAAVAATAHPRNAQPAAVRATTTTVIGFALATGVFIACYTIWDKYAVSNLHTDPILQGYAGFPMMTAVFAPVVLTDRARLGQVWRTFRPQVLGAALLSPLAYILVLAALSFTAVSAVAPAREVSVLFGVLLGRRLLGEGSLGRRLAAAAAIVAGIIAVAIG